MFIDWSTAIAESAGTAMLEVVGADPFRQPDWWLSASAGCGPNRPEARSWQRTYAPQKELLPAPLPSWLEGQIDSGGEGDNEDCSGRWCNCTCSGTAVAGMLPVIGRTCVVAVYPCPHQCSLSDDTPWSR